MAARLFNLRNVPEDEADEVRELLRRHGFDFYETPPGNWGLSAGAFWLRDEGQLDRAKALLVDYQAERARRARADYERRRSQGRVPTFLDNLRERPLEVLFYLALALFFLYLTLVPVLHLAG